MTSKSNRSYQVKMSKTECPIPVVNGVHLHSIYNPQKQGLELVKKYQSLIVAKDHLLVLGLGFGYHIKEIENILLSTRPEFQIIVVEPDNYLIELFKQNTEGFCDNIEIISHSKVEDYYHDIRFVDYLIYKPGIIIHNPSYNLNRDFYEGLLSHKANKDFNKDITFIKNPELRDYLSQGQNNQSRWSHFMKAFEELNNCNYRIS